MERVEICIPSPEQVERALASFVPKLRPCLGKPSQIGRPRATFAFRAQPWLRAWSLGWIVGGPMSARLCIHKHLSPRSAVHSRHKFALATTRRAKTENGNSGTIGLERRAGNEIVGHGGRTRLGHGIYRESVRKKLYRHLRGLCFQLGTQVFPLAANVRFGLLRN